MKHFRRDIKLTEIIFATGNKDKMREIREIMADCDVHIVSMKEAGIRVDIVEDGTTFEENAKIKARAVAAHTDAIVLADDSGLEIDALNKEPGVYSARYMGEDTSYDVKNKNLIDRLDGVPKEKRTARFVCAIAAVLPDGRELVTRQTMEGYIGWEPEGENGFGYDPIFYLDEYGCSSAAISPEQKNAISHRGKALRAMKELLKKAEFLGLIDEIEKMDVPDINVGNISKRTPQLAIFDFRSFLDLAMLLVESQPAKSLRQIMLDIVIDFINQKAGGGTKYINQRDSQFLGAFLQEENYRREFTDALRDYVDMGNAKYGIYTDKIYQSIFREKAKEYRQILRLSDKEKVRDTFYSEILTLIASYECGLADMIKQQSESLGHKLNNWELTDLFNAFESLPLWKPLIIQARTKMASRDMALRDAFHYQLEEYIKPLSGEEYEKFLGQAGDELEKLMSENKDVLKRLKESE